MNIYFFTVTFEDGRIRPIHIRAVNKRHAKQGLEFNLIGQKVRTVELDAVEKDYQ